MQRARQKPIRVLFIDDYIIMRAGLRLLLENQSHMIVVGEARNKAEALAMASQEQPDVILLSLDLGCERGLDFIPELIAVSQRGKIIAITGSRNSLEQARAIQLGVQGLVLRENDVSHLIDAIERVHQGECSFDQTVSPTLVGRISTNSKKIKKPDLEKGSGVGLTKRELQIITLVSMGLKNQQIADRLHISEGTVRNHLTVIYEKLSVVDRFELIVYAYRHGIAKAIA